MSIFRVEKIDLGSFPYSPKIEAPFLVSPHLVSTNSIIIRVLSRPEILDNLIKWMTEMSEFDIEYQYRITIKAQALAEFLVETLMLKKEAYWRVYVDGSATFEGSDMGVLLISPKGDKIKVAVQLRFKTSNNEAKYEALLIGL